MRRTAAIGPCVVLAEPARFPLTHDAVQRRINELERMLRDRRRERTANAERRPVPVADSDTDPGAIGDTVDRGRRAGDGANGARDAMDRGDEDEDAGNRVGDSRRHASHSSGGSDPGLSGRPGDAGIGDELDDGRSEDSGSEAVGDDDVLGVPGRRANAAAARTDPLRPRPVAPVRPAGRWLATQAQHAADGVRHYEQRLPFVAGRVRGRRGRRGRRGAAMSC